MKSNRSWRLGVLLCGAVMGVTACTAPTVRPQLPPAEQAETRRRVAALDPLDQEAVKSGWPRVGMSADALRLVWGEPAYTRGNARRWARWYYYGSSFARGATPASPWDFATRVEVYLADGKVVGWVDVVPTTQDSGDGGGWN